MVLLVIFVFWLVIGSAAACVALFVKDDEQRGDRALAVLKHVTRYGLGPSAVVAVVTSDKAVDLLRLLGS